MSIASGEEQGNRDASRARAVASGDGVMDLATVDVFRLGHRGASRSSPERRLCIGAQGCRPVCTVLLDDSHSGRPSARTAGAPVALNVEVRRRRAAGRERNEDMHLHSMRPALLIMAALALLATSRLGAGERLTMRVTPRTAHAPATVTVDAVAERDPANRGLQIQLLSSEYYRSSLMQLDGDQAARTTTVRYEGVPGGTYEVRVVLLGSNGQQRAAIAQPIEIISMMGR